MSHRMTRSLLLPLPLLVLAVAVAGCRNESVPGGPGVEVERREAPVEQTARYRPADPEGTFTIVAPRAATRVGPGGRESVTIDINRHGGFNQDVSLEFETPSGIRVLPDEATIHAGTTQTKILVEAEVNAVPGDTSIMVRAIPTTGRAVAVRVPVRIERPRD